MAGRRGTACSAVVTLHLLQVPSPATVRAQLCIVRGAVRYGKLAVSFSVIINHYEMNADTGILQGLVFDLCLAADRKVSPGH